MGRAGWILTIIGIAAGLISSCKDEDPDRMPDGYRLASVFRCDGPLTADCSGSAPITEYTQVRIFNDWDLNGPDEQDVFPVPFGYRGLPEAWFANYADFYFSGSSFVSPAFESSGVQNNVRAFYLRAYSGEDGRVVWTSPKFSLIFHPGLPDTVELPFDEWTCALADTSAPSCLPVPGWIEIHNSVDYVPYCIETCPGGSSWLVYRNLDSTRENDLPILKFEGGCDDEPDAEIQFNPAAWYKQGSIPFWQTDELRGLSYGKRTIVCLDSVPCTRIDTISVSQTDSSVQVSWHTSFELNSSYFEIWVLGLPDSESYFTNLGEVGSARNASGASYNMTIPRIESEYTHECRIIVVDDEGNKFPAGRIDIDS